MKKIYTMALLLLMTSNLMAVEKNKMYVGAGLTSGSGIFTMTSGSVETKQDYDSSSTPFKIGYIMNNHNRFEFSYESMDHKFKDGTETVSGWNIDWDFTFSEYKTKAITPYITLGFGSYTYEDTAKLLVENKDLKGFAINYGFGGLYEVNKNIEIEASFKWKNIKWQNVKLLNNDELSSNSDGSALYVGINYKF